MTDETTKSTRRSGEGHEREIHEAVQGLAGDTEGAPREGGEGLDLLSGTIAGNPTPQRTTGLGRTYTSME